MIKVKIPENCKEEIEYTIYCLLTEFLGVKYEIEINEEVDDFHFDLGNKSIIIKNHFFKRKEYNNLYSLEQVPSKVNSGNLILNKREHSLVAIFGEISLIENNNNYTLDVDIVAATFFMLSRWEEWANPARDSHDRFDFNEALAIKCNFIHRPIINEYLDFFWDLLLTCGYRGTRRKRAFKIIPTHDVDIPYMWWSKKQMIRSLAGKLYHRKFRALNRQFWLGIQGKDPFDTHDLFMDLSDEIGVKSHFFFMTGGNTSYDNRYKINHPRVINLIKNIQRRGHQIGLHPSYNSYNNIDFLKKEKEKLERTANVKINTGRQHYLRFSLPDTWNNWDKVGMDWDSTLTYSGNSGFRCGICFPFPVFDILRRKRLRLYEKPLIVMEATLLSYEKLSLASAKEKIKSLKNTTKKYRGEFVFLWHNSSFNVERVFGYESLINSLYKIEE